MNHIGTHRPDRARLLLGILDALLHLAEKPRSVAELALGQGVSVVAAGDALVSLERRGLVDAERLRLTMHGLAAASALRAASVGERERIGLQLAA
ncbi:MAG: hypothetical protein AAGH15_08180 [Myxococcota bacterium]